MNRISVIMLISSCLLSFGIGICGGLSSEKRRAGSGSSRGTGRNSISSHRRRGQIWLSSSAAAFTPAPYEAAKPPRATFRHLCLISREVLSSRRNPYACLLVIGAKVRHPKCSQEAIVAFRRPELAAFCPTHKSLSIGRDSRSGRRAVLLAPFLIVVA